MQPIAIAEVICAVFIAVSMVGQFNRPDENRLIRWLRFSMLIVLITLISDALSYTTVGKIPFPLKHFIDFISYVSGCFLLIAFTRYCEEYVNSKTKMKRWPFLLMYALEGVYAVCITLEFYAGHIIEYDADGIEIADNGFPPYLTAIEIAILLIVPIIAILKRKKLERRAVDLLIFYFVAPLLTTLVTVKFDVDLEAIVFAVSIDLIATILHKDVVRVHLEERNATLAEKNQVLERSLKLEQKLAEQGVFTGYLLASYESAYYVGLKSLDWIVYKRSDELSREYPVEEDYVTSLGNYLQKTVHKDDQKQVAILVQPGKILEKLKKEPSFRITYREVREGTEAIMQCEVIRGSDEDHAAFGFKDVTEQMDEQRKRLLGAVQLSPDVLIKAKIGMWAFELDDGAPPRMYADESMLKLLGLTKQVRPEEIYHAWYDHIDADSLDLVHDAVERMKAGEHSEVQYPWHHPNGQTMMVRCGGVRNYEYTKGIRIEGTHQDLTQTIHFDEEARNRAKQLENELIKTKLRGDALAYIGETDASLDQAIDFLGRRVIDILKCEQFVFRDTEGLRIVVQAEGIDEVKPDVCAQCPYYDIKAIMYQKNNVVLDDCSLGLHGEEIYPCCPTKSLLMQQVSIGNKVSGWIAAQYFSELHTFTERDIDIMSTVAMYCAFIMGQLSEKRAQQERLEADASNKAKSEFLFHMSHDIRTPMSAIIGFTEKAIRHKDEPKILTESLDKIRISSNYLVNLVNDVLDMARIESGKLELKEELHYSDQAGESIVEVFTAEAKKKDIILHTTFETTDKYLWIDETRVNQIIANILSNAIKYTEPGGEIWYTTKQLPSDRKGYGKYESVIKDTGRGMSKEFLEKIYNSFERENPATSSSVQGTGLGMAIVKRLIDAMGGTIEIQSEVGKGTTVSFVMYHKVATPEEIEKYKEEHISMPTREQFDFSGKKVLLVEDNDFNREIAIDILQNQGFVIEQAENGQQAVDILREKGPDFFDYVLMDIQMPVMNGYEAAKQIRAMYPNAKIPIIALSANAFVEDRVKSLEVGMDEHIAKPIDVGNLLTVMTNLAR